MRIAGITIPDNKRLEIALTSVFGIGRPRAHTILSTAGIEFGRRASTLTPAEEASIRKEIEKYNIEGDLRRQVSMHIKHLKDTQSYRGTRHMKKLPVRGQRTRTNTRTVRGNVRKTMTSGKRKLEKT
ncbi:MAG: 30S ribosomal protein S13 [Parcubacteria group bacterium]|nr:30S ribosomal protein S13 [Parcubacteria group bacterium]